MNIGFARYSVPVVTGERRHEREYAGRLPWCPGFNQTSTHCLSSKDGRRHICRIRSRPTRTRSSCRSARAWELYTNVGQRLRIGPIRTITAQINDRMNFTIMREIPGQFKVDATWFMNIGRYVPHDLQVNLADPNLSYTYKAQLSQNIANPFYNYLTPDVFPGALRNQATVHAGAVCCGRIRSTAVT